MAGNNGPKIVTNGLLRCIDASYYGGFGRPDTYDAISQGYQVALTPKDFVQNVIYYPPANFGALFNLNGIRCISSRRQEPTGSSAYSHYTDLNRGTVNITSNSNRTCECWVYMVSNTAGGDGYGNLVSVFTLFHWGQASVWSKCGLGIYSDTNVAIHGWGTTTYALSSTVPSLLNRWVLVGFTNNGNTVSFYVNGEPTGTATVALGTTTTEFNTTINGLGYTNPSCYWGAMRIYNRQLSAAEMKQNFTAHKGRYKL